MIPELRDILFLDIETVANTHEYESLDERIKTHWARKAIFFKKDMEQTDEDISIMSVPGFMLSLERLFV